VGELTAGALLAHPALPLLLAAVLMRLVPDPVGRALMVLAPAVALVSVLVLDLDTTVAMPFLDFDLEVLRADVLARAFGLVFAIAAMIAGIYGLATQAGPERTAALAYAGAAMGVVYAGDLLTFFLFWEIKAIASTFVILSRRSHLSGRAGMRYLFVHIAGGKILLAGILVHLSTTGSIAFDAFEPSVAAFLIMTACALSAGVPPLHAWLKDAYPEATVAGTVFLSAFTTKAAVYALIRGFAGFEILIYLGVLMALYGVIYAILENDIRRLLSYHIVSQVGFMVTAVGIGTTAAVNGATAHAFAHILYKGLLLMGVGTVLYATGRSKASELGGLWQRMRGAAVLYMIGAVSISSVPLFSGFISKELIPYAAGNADLAWVVVALKVVSVGTFLSTGLKLPYATFVGQRGVGPPTNDGAPFAVRAVPVSMYVAMGMGAALNIALGLIPDLLYRWMPTEIDRAPYAFGPVVEKVQILGFTILGYLLLRSLLKAKPVLALDLDWLYRRLPRYVSAAIAGRRAGTPAPRAAADEPASQPEPATARTPGSTAPDEDTAPASGAAQAPATASTAVLAEGAAGDDTANDRITGLLARTFTPSEGPPDVVGTWALGAVVLAASVLLLLMSLLS
jgi:multicomponent Na+:H+ antiporter subunit D